MGYMIYGDCRDGDLSYESWAIMGYHEIEPIEQT